MVLVVFSLLHHNIQNLEFSVLLLSRNLNSFYQLLSIPTYSYLPIKIDLQNVGLTIKTVLVGSVTSIKTILVGFVTSIKTVLIGSVTSINYLYSIIEFY